MSAIFTIIDSGQYDAAIILIAFVIVAVCWARRGK